ncbi:hypothetical protein FHR24_003031 [Wenyingzhuangia heitensis]|uniref:Uncharacterized protein n=1 Tax=Wenyingzhuangia heitensis TaxID=1487859 RepID=A0ABX0UCI9_9FLAO|nr:hypothetical protein [Wenyingzhuangia heitensis]NIJ46542.1 hypothetical protein [Wenyingzhuangia heitensis]
MRKEFFKDGNSELYNLQKDLLETKNLAEIEVKKAKKLLKQLQKWRVSVGLKCQF